MRCGRRRTKRRARCGASRLGASPASRRVLRPFGPRSTGDAPRRSFNTAQKKALEKEKRDLEKEAQKRIAEERAKEEARARRPVVQSRAIFMNPSHDAVGGHSDRVDGNAPRRRPRRNEGWRSARTTARTRRRRRRRGTNRPTLVNRRRTATRKMRPRARRRRSSTLWYWRDLKKENRRFPSGSPYQRSRT